jgi:dimethylamine/trimethylamine dehydrogenase
MTLDQWRIQARLVELGVHVHTSVQLVGLRRGNDQFTVEFSGIYGQKPKLLACSSIVMVTMRDPDDGLYAELKACEHEWRAADLESVTCVGDARAPGTVAAAVFAGHRAARELDCRPACPDAVPFRRE